MWYCMPIALALRGAEEGGFEFKARLGYMARPSYKSQVEPLCVNKAGITQMAISKELFEVKSEGEILYNYSYEIRTLKTIRAQNNVKI